MSVSNILIYIFMVALVIAHTMKLILSVKDYPYIYRYSVHLCTYL